MTKYKQEPFKDLTEALLWCAENKPVFHVGKLSDTESETWEVHEVRVCLADKQLHKAIEFKTKKIVVERWANVYDGLIVSSGYNSREDADEGSICGRIACIPLTGAYEVEVE